MHPINRKDFLRAVAASLAAGAPVLGQAAETSFPSQPVRLILSFPPGGAADVIGRSVARKLTERWGQQVVVDNRPGGNSIVSVQELTRQKPDGYNLLLALDGTLVMNQHLFRVPKYDPLKDFTLIGGLAEFPLFLMTRTDSGVKTAQEYLTRAKSENGNLRVGVSAVLTTIGADVLNYPAGATVTWVQYKGTGDATLGLLRGDVDFIVDVDASAAQHIKTGKLKVLATSAGKRIPTYPDAPTYKEVLGKDAELTAWYGVVGPAGVAPVLASKIAEDFGWAIQQPDVKATLLEKSIFPAPSNAAALRTRVEADARKYGEIIRRLNLQID